MKRNYIIQLHTGSFTSCTYTFAQIKAKLEPIINTYAIKDIILGWCTDKQLNSELVSYFHKHQIRCFLWLPILSESERLKPNKMIETIDGSASDALSMFTDEQFAFACPSALCNSHHVLQIYEEHFQGIPFNGVFLDKIRFPSFANGYEEGFGCFCKECLHHYHDVDIEYIQQLVKDHDVRLLQGEYDSLGHYQFQDQQVHQFYQQRSRIISEEVFRLAAYFNSRKMIVGADVYAPFLAYHVGQDIAEIGKIVDFVKPMFYRHTKAPAGMQYEYEHYTKHFVEHSNFDAHWHGDPTSVESIKKQCSFLDHIHANVCPGIEINPITGICDVQATSFQESLALLAAYPTITLSWDIMQTSEEILRVLNETDKGCDN